MTSDHPVKRRKKLIEVAIPLEAINQACQEEKAVPRRGHPGTIHFWWAPRPLAASRAIIFCQLVDDPSEVPELFKSQEEIEVERLRLFALISRLASWDNTCNKDVLNEARREILASWKRYISDNYDDNKESRLQDPDLLPPFLDPFAGGGAIPLEAQRLGMRTTAADLNPVSTIINKAKIEIPSSIPSGPPLFRESQGDYYQKELTDKNCTVKSWSGSTGIAEDVRLAGLYVLERIRRLASWAYPTIAITPGLVLENSGVRDDLDGLIGKELPVLACFWARTIESPSPAFSGRQVPLIKSWVLAEKKNLHYWLDVHTDDGECSFSVFKGTPQEGRHAKGKRDFKGSKSGFRCLLSGDALTFKSIREYANNKKLGYKLLAVICQAPGKRVYLAPSQEYEEHCLSVKCQDPPNQDLPDKALGFRVQEYGMKKWEDLYLPRQLYILDEFAKEIQQLGSSNEFKDFSLERLEAVKTYLACALSRLADYNNAFCSWNIKGGSVSHLFTKHAIPMSWDFVEVCPLEDFSGCWEGAVNWVVDVLRARKDRQVESSSLQRDARMTPSFPKSIISTDPPYYDNIGYADLSDFFYVWMKKALKGCYGSILATTLTPKADELIASPFRHPKENADQFFLEGMTDAMTALKLAAHPFAPITIYYAFKQTETGNGGTVQTGWSSFLQAVIKSGLQILGTWPVHTERAARAIGIGTNALASSVVLVCQPVTESRPVFSRSEFKRKLRAEISARLQIMESASISPVDIAQAVIGPGMAVYSSAKAVLNPDDTPIEVREALIEINAVLDECLSKGEGELDPESRFALTFFESYGYTERDFGDAEGLAKARNISVEGVVKAGIMRSVAGKSWLLKREDLDGDWDPARDARLCVWEATQHLIKRLESGGEGAAGDLLKQLKKISGHGDLASNCRALAYRLYNHCEKTKQAEEARAYNGLVIAWPELEKLAAASASPVQSSLL